MQISISGMIALASHPAMATADGPDFYAVKGVGQNDVLNMRVGPSAIDKKIGEIPYNARHLKNLGCRGGSRLKDWLKTTPNERSAAGKQRWCKIRYRGIEGWVAGWFLAEDTAPHK